MWFYESKGDAVLPIEEYLLDCYGLAETTRELYSTHLHRFAESVGDQPVTSQCVRHYMAHLRQMDGTEYSRSYLDQVYRTLNTFFNWCIGEGHMQVNPMTHVRKPKVPQRKSPRLSKNQVFQLLAEAGKQSVRNLVIILLMVDSGLRRGEVLNLKLSDLYLERGSAMVMGKDRQEREVPLGHHTIEALESYLAVRPETSTERVFVTERYRAPLTRNGLGSVIRRLQEKVGFDVHCHLLRHTFANHFVANGGSVKKLQKILGHNQYSTTADLYLDPEYVEVAAEHERCSILSHLRLQVRE